MQGPRQDQIESVHKLSISGTVRTDRTHAMGGEGINESTDAELVTISVSGFKARDCAIVCAIVCAQSMRGKMVQTSSSVNRNCGEWRRVFKRSFFATTLADMRPSVLEEQHLRHR